MVSPDKVMVGFAGGEFGIKGQILALDTKTGNEVWKASTLPDPGGPGSETWGKDSLKYGGALAPIQNKGFQHISGLWESWRPAGRWSVPHQLSRCPKRSHSSLTGR